MSTVGVDNFCHRLIHLEGNLLFISPFFISFHFCFWVFRVFPPTLILLLLIPFLILLLFFIIWIKTGAIDGCKSNNVRSFLFKSSINRMLKKLTVLKKLTAWKGSCVNFGNPCTMYQSKVYTTSQKFGHTFNLVFFSFRTIYIVGSHWRHQN